MSQESSNVLGFAATRPLRSRPADDIEHVMLQRPLRRVLAFTGRSIDDVVNSPVAKNHVRSYFKLYKWVQRGIDINELERQWSPLPVGE
jgi:hypothetical protein